jgi:hypothetical protein
MALEQESLALRPGLASFENRRGMYEYPGNPESIARIVKVQGGHELDIARQSRYLLHELSDDFGIDIVPFQIAVVGVGRLLYQVERVPGVGFHMQPDPKYESAIRSSSLTKVQHEASKRLFEKEYSYMLFKFATKGTMLHDIFSLRQVVLNDDRAVVVDIEPWINDLASPSLGMNFRWQGLAVLDLSESVTALLEDDPVALAKWKLKFGILLDVMFEQNGITPRHQFRKRLLRRMLSPKYRQDGTFDHLEYTLEKEFKKQYKGRHRR